MTLSLSQRLILTLAFIICSVLGTSSIFTYYRVTNSINGNYDARLMSDAHFLWVMAQEKPLEDKHDIEKLDLDAMAPSMSAAEHSALIRMTQWRAYRVWKGGRVSELSDTADYLGEIPPAAPGFSRREIQGIQWQVYTIQNPAQHVSVEAWENLTVRNHLVWRLMRQEITPAILLFPLFVILVVFGVRYSLRDLYLMARQISDRKMDDLSNLPFREMPKELRPLKHALNLLLERLRLTMSREHEFIENAAHELKTPLATLKLQGQLIRQAPNEAERNECIETLEAGLNRTRHVFDQILTLSRISAQAVERRPCNIKSLVADVSAQYAAVAASKDVDLSLEGTKFIAETNAELLKMLAGILIENAVKYTPPGGAVQVIVADGRIDVVDTGRGISPGDADKVFERFYRGKGDETPGSGLGLAIAKKCADLLGVEIALEPNAPAPGLSAIVRFNGA